MDAIELLTGRRSIRSFTSQEVSQETLAEIVALARFAPSWKNSQTVRYLAVMDADTREKIAQDAVMGFSINQNTIRDAPALIILTTVNGRSGFERDGSPSTDKGTHWQSFDAGAAAQTFCLAACHFGLGTVIMGIYDESKLRSIVPVPEGESVSAMIALGYPAETPPAPKRKDVSDLLRIIEMAKKEH